MALPPSLKTAFKAAILAETDPTLVALRTANNEDGMAAWYNGDSAFVCWRTNVSRSEVYNRTSADGTNWSWTIYKAQGVSEQNAWTQMFMGDQADFSAANLRAGVSAIFTAASAANGTHALAIGKRFATRAERIFASGTGTAQSPATFGWQGTISAQDISDALSA